MYWPKLSLSLCKNTLTFIQNTVIVQSCETEVHSFNYPHCTFLNDKFHHRCEILSMATQLNQFCVFKAGNQVRIHTVNRIISCRSLVNGIPYHRQICLVLGEPRQFYPIAGDQRLIVKTNLMTMDEDYVNIKRLRQLMCIFFTYVDVSNYCLFICLFAFMFNLLTLQ